MMKALLILLVALPWTLFATPKNIIVMIPDGTGHASLTAARQLKGAPLALDGCIYGLVETRSADNSVTDSAAAATAMACGKRTYNGAVGVDINRVPLRSLAEWAHEKGKAVGIVTTDAITGATPGGFSAHVPSRRNAADILEQQIASGFELFLGGGAKTLNDEHKTFMQQQGYTLVTTADALKHARGKLFGLFAPGIMTAEVARKGTPNTNEPHLEEMAEKALDLLKDDPDGFFLMIEGAQVDKGNHDNDLPWATYELLAFDATVARVLAWASKHPDTLVLIVPDHETGGLTLLNEPHEGARAKALRAVSGKGIGKPGDYFVHYSTTWHTGVDVFLAGNTPDCRPTRNCDIPYSIIGETTEPFQEIQGKTLQEGAVYYLETADGQRLRANRDAIYIQPTGKWYRR